MRLRSVGSATLVVALASCAPHGAPVSTPASSGAGVRHVFVNGTHVIKDGEHTGAKPGRALWGPGKVH